MENNIFYKQNKNKFNPDIENKYKELLNYREKYIFNSSNFFYNPVTGIVPNNVTKIQDLLLNNTNNNSNKNIPTLISEKEKERKLQDLELLEKYNKIKIQHNEVNNNKLEISDFDKLKNNSNNSNNKDYIILENLKKLGIL